MFDKTGSVNEHGAVTAGDESQQLMKRLTRLAVSRYCTGAGPGPISAIGVSKEVTKLVA